MAEAAKKKKVFDGRYEVISIVGRGAASVVYHARHVGSVGSEVALKVLMKQPAKEGSKLTNSDLLRKEALAMVSARHKYVVRLDDFHSLGDICYLAMEFATSGDLRKFAGAHGGKLDSERGTLFLKQAGEGLDFIHRVGIVHRDIKPDNILVMNDKDIRLADFGVAVLPGETSSIKDLQAGVGTMSYMAPEVLEGISYDKRSDIYSLAVTFYEMFSGVHPFEKAPLMQQLEVRREGAITPLQQIAPHVPAIVATGIMQALSYDPAKRFASCQEFLEAVGMGRSSTGGPAKTQPVAPSQAPAQEPVPQKPPSSPAEAPVKRTNQPSSVVAPSAPMDKPMSEGVDKTIVATEKPREREIKPDTRLQKEVPPTAPQPKSAATSPQAASAIENRKPKRSLEDLRKLARENRSQQPPQSGGNSRLSPRSRLKLAGFFPALIAVVVFGTLYQLYQRGTFSVPFSSSVDQENSAPTIDSPIPEEQPDAIAFPELSAGVYQGSISGFLGKNPIALSMVSMGAERGIIVFLGIPGWTPQIVQPEGGTESIRVASNGMIVDLKGTVEGTSIRGTMSNLVTGEQGTWQAERVQK